MSTPSGTSVSSSSRADIGVIGGSGFYQFLDDAERVRVEHAVRRAQRRRRGRRGRGPPGGVPRPARAGPPVPPAPGQLPGQPLGPARGGRPAGARAVRGRLAACPSYGPGTLVVPDQVVDRTWGREHTVYDGAGPGRARRLRRPLLPARPGRRRWTPSGRRLVRGRDGGTLVVINGPRFSSRAESCWHRQAGWTVVGMTGMPEASIARELAMCFTTVALVTDHDAGVEGGEAVSHAEVLRVFGDNVSGLKQTLRAAIGALPPAEDDDAATCACRRALDGLPLPLVLPTPRTAAGPPRRPGGRRGVRASAAPPGAAGRRGRVGRGRTRCRRPRPRASRRSPHAGSASGR